MQHGWVRLPIADWQIHASAYEVEDLLTGERYHWRGEWNYVRLDPGYRPAHVLRVGTPAGLAGRPARGEIAPEIARHIEELTT